MNRKLTSGCTLSRLEHKICYWVFTWVFVKKPENKYDYYYYYYYIYRPQRSCEGYVFTRVCHSVRGGVPGRGEVPGPGGSAPGGCLLPGGCLVQGGMLRGVVCTEADLPGRDGYCCGRYASYWIAFLLLFAEYFRMDKSKETALMLWVSS